MLTTLLHLQGEAWKHNMLLTCAMRLRCSLSCNAAKIFRSTWSHICKPYVTESTTFHCIQCLFEPKKSLHRAMQDVEKRCNLSEDYNRQDLEMQVAAAEVGPHNTVLMQNTCLSFFACLLLLWTLYSIHLQWLLCRTSADVLKKVVLALDCPYSGMSLQLQCSD